jgi:hypothetical protein
MLMSDKPGFCRERECLKVQRTRAKREKLGLKGHPKELLQSAPTFLAICPMTRQRGTEARGVACSCTIIRTSPETRDQTPIIIDDQPDFTLPPGGGIAHPPSF